MPSMVRRVPIAPGTAVLAHADTSPNWQFAVNDQYHCVYGAGDMGVTSVGDLYYHGGGRREFNNGTLQNPSCGGSAVGYYTGIDVDNGPILGWNGSAYVQLLDHSLTDCSDNCADLWVGLLGGGHTPWYPTYI
jgi:hypothetical protein